MRAGEDAGDGRVGTGGGWGRGGGGERPARRLGVAREISCPPTGRVFHRAFIIKYWRQTRSHPRHRRARSDRVSMLRSKRPRLSAAPQHTAGNASSEDAGDVPVPVPPGNLLCPISLCMYRDPVVVVESGHTYDRSQIMQHFARRQTDPKTNRRLHSTMVVTNWAAREKQEVARGVKRKRAPPTKGPCEHGVKPRSSCKACSACPHGKRRRRCKECGGTSIREHGLCTL